MIGNPKILIIPFIIALVAWIFISEAVKALMSPETFNPLINLGIGISILAIAGIYAGMFGKRFEGSQLTTILIVATIFISLGLLL